MLWHSSGIKLSFLLIGIIAFGSSFGVVSTGQRAFIETFGNTMAQQNYLLGQMKLTVEFSPVKWKKLRFSRATHRNSAAGGGHLENASQAGLSWAGRQLC